MRPVAFAGVAALLRQLRKAGQALGLSGAVIALMSLWKAAAAVMSDLCANCAQDVLNTWLGRTGEFVVLVALFGFSMWLIRREKERTAPQDPIESRQSPRSIRLLRSRVVRDHLQRAKHRLHIRATLRR